MSDTRIRDEYLDDYLARQARLAEYRACAITDTDELLARMRALGKGDEEYDHIEADAILCNLLVLLGQGPIVDAYETISKWYA
jgi:hypothetical protein